jgi:hypothetical protein
MRSRQSHTARWWAPSDIGRCWCSSPGDTSGANTSRCCHRRHCRPPSRRRPRSHHPLRRFHTGRRSRTPRTTGWRRTTDSSRRCCHTRRARDPRRTGPGRHNTRRSWTHHTGPSSRRPRHRPFRQRFLRPGLHPLRRRSLHLRRSRPRCPGSATCTRPTRTSAPAHRWRTDSRASRTRSCRSRSCTRPSRRSSPDTWWENTAGATARTPTRGRHRPPARARRRGRSDS